MYHIYKALFCLYGKSVNYNKMEKNILMYFCEKQTKFAKKNYYIFII